MPDKPPLYPLRFAPIFKSAIWGGRRIADYFPNAPAEGPISEVWLVSDVANNASIVADGPLAGTTLRDLARSRSDELGLSNHDGFPLLIKIIDAREPLSVQVHPNDEEAQRLENQPRGKTEAWYVIDAEPGAKVYGGFKSGVNRAAFLDAFHAGRIEETLHSFEAKAGDCIYLPAGTIHAAGAGLAIFEVQQTSDITYRLHDWGRVDSKTGKPRELHVEKAIECLDFDRGPVAPERIRREDAEVEFLTGCNYFSLYRIKADRPFSVEFPIAHAFACIDGKGRVESDGGSAVIQRGDTVLIPPGSHRVEPDRGMTWIDCRPV
jgi:mannose-6-phosphate isomerase